MADYDFRSLSPVDFERFCRDLLNAELGLQFTTYAVGPDNGIDIRNVTPGRLVVGQCKHRPDMTSRQLVALAGTEVARWTTEAIDGYYLIVSAAVTPPSEGAVETALAALPGHPPRFYHRDRLNSVLARHRTVERRHFKLWLASTEVLAAIEHAEDWQRSEALLMRATDRARLHVTTPAFGDAVERLNEHGAVIIGGAPGIGKSTLAELLLLNLWRDGWTVCNVVGGLDGAWRAVRTAGDHVVIYYDDFLGQSGIAEVSGTEMGDLEHLITFISRHRDRIRLVMTTRLQPLNAAGSAPDDRLRRLSAWAQDRIVVLSQFTRAERAAMLYNHLYFARQSGASWLLPRDERRLLDIVDHPNFSPRIIESVVLRRPRSDTEGLLHALEAAHANPAEVWGGSFRQLPDVAVILLLALVLFPGQGAPHDTLYAKFSREDPRRWNETLKLLEGTWITIDAIGHGIRTVRLFDGSRRDFLLAAIGNDQALLDLALRRVFSSRQHLILSGLQDSADVGLRTLLQQRELARQHQLLGAAPRGLTAAWDAANSQRTRNQHARTAGAPIRLDSNPSREVIAELTALARLVPLQAEPSERAQLTALLVESTSRLLIDHRTSWAEAPSLLALAVRTASLSGPDAADIAARAAAAAVQAAVSLDDVQDFTALPVVVQDRAFALGADRALEDILVSEVDAIDDLDDPASRYEALEAVEIFLQETNVPTAIDIEYERSRIDEYDQQWQRPRNTPYRPDIIPANDDDDDDRALMDLFNSLD